MHHDQPVPVPDGILHVVSDHQRSQFVFINKLVCKPEHLIGGLRVVSYADTIPFLFIYHIDISLLYILLLSAFVNIFQDQRLTK